MRKRHPCASNRVRDAMSRILPANVGLSSNPSTERRPVVARSSLEAEVHTFNADSRGHDRAILCLATSQRIGFCLVACRASSEHLARVMFSRAVTGPCQGDRRLKSGRVLILKPRECQRNVEGVGNGPRGEESAIAFVAQFCEGTV